MKRNTLILLSILSIIFSALSVNADPSGEWSFIATDGGMTIGYDAATDSLGNVYQVGSSWYGDLVGNSTNKTVEGAETSSDNDAYLMKIDPDGVRQWTFVASADDSYGAVPYSVAVDDNDDAYFAGSTTSPSTTANSTNKVIDGSVSEGSTTPFIMKVSKEGIRQWTYILGNSGYGSIITAVDVDSSGNVYAVGWTNYANGLGTSTNRYIEGTVDGANSYADFFVVKVNSSGLREWTYIAGSLTSKNDRGMAIEALDNGTVYVSGFSYSPTDFGGSANRIIENEIASWAPFLMRINPAGSREWTNIGAGMLSEVNGGIASDSDNNAYLLSWSSESYLSNYSNAYIDGDKAGSGLLVSKIFGNGTTDWIYVGDGSGYAKDIVVDDSGNIFIATETAIGYLNFTNVSLRVLDGIETNDDPCILKLNSSGRSEWLYALGSGSSGSGSQPSGIDIDSSGNVFFTGRTGYGEQIANDTPRTIEGNLGTSESFLFKLGEGGGSPSYSSFTGTNTTNFSAVPDITNVTNLTLATATGNSIQFPEDYGIDAADEDYDNNIIFGDCFVSVNSSALDLTFNATAYLTMNNSDGHCGNNIIFASDTFYLAADPIRAEEEQCTICDQIQKTNDFITRFRVGHFSSYAIGANSRLDIYDEFEGSSVPVDTDIDFFANYTNSTSGVHIDTGTCKIEFDDNSTWYTMTENGDNFNYTLASGFSTATTHTFHVNCTDAVYNDLNTTDDISVTSGGGTIPEFNALTLLLAISIILAGILISRKT